MWRKNRRPVPAGHSNATCTGVDINRNYDFLWDFPQFFHPAAPIRNSTDPCDAEIYIGPGAVLEPETKNAVWIFDQFPQVRYFIDIHSFSETILYTWGDGTDQTTNPDMNFRNLLYDGKRGKPNDTVYREYLKPSDKTAVLKPAKEMRGAIKAVRGQTYKSNLLVSIRQREPQTTMGTVAI